MKVTNTAILTSGSSWFKDHAVELSLALKDNGYTCDVYSHHKDVKNDYDVVFYLSYFNIVKKDFLDKHSFNLVVHESDLPKGRGWAPLFWQILEGNNSIPIVLFEAAEGVDSGPIYFKDEIILNGDELHEEIRLLQAKKTKELCLEFLKNHENIQAVEQSGETSLYPKRTPKDSELDINKTILEQFDLLRIVNNDDFPAFFIHKDKKYILKISKEESE